MITFPTPTPGTERSDDPDLFMLTGQFLLALALLLFASDLSARASEPASPHRILLLDGQNNHDWRSTTPLIKSALERTGRFTVTVATSPATSAPASAWAQFHPNFKDYAAVVSNYNDFGAPPTPVTLLDDLTAYVRAGGSLVIVHAANSGMNHYPEFAKLVGMGWSMTNANNRLYVDDTGKTIRQPAGQGPATAHGKPFSWPVTLWATNHPICVGLPRIWLHETDELWAAPRGPAENVEILATAVPPETKQNDPVLWTVTYGKGRVFVTLLGHDAPAMKCVGFQTLLARGTEWTITGQVTLPVPQNFPTADHTSLIPSPAIHQP
jgi:hypothetical protein